MTPPCGRKPRTSWGCDVTARTGDDPGVRLFLCGEVKSRTDPGCRPRRMPPVCGHVPILLVIPGRTPTAAGRPGPLPNGRAPREGVSPRVHSAPTFRGPGGRTAVR